MHIYPASSFLEVGYLTKWLYFGLQILTFPKFNTVSPKVWAYGWAAYLSHKAWTYMSLSTER